MKGVMKMDVKKLDNTNTGNVSGGRSTGIFDRLLYRTIKNVCTECGKNWEYKQSRFGDAALPGCATSPWCPACRAKRMEEALKKQEALEKSEQKNNT